MSASKPLYVETIGRIERLHRCLLDLIGNEFSHLGWDDVTPVQALMLFNIGDKTISAGDLKGRGFYQGTNASYNVKKLVETGYLFREASQSDRRSIRLRLSPKGEEVAETVDELLDRHLKEDIESSVFKDLNAGMSELELFWRRQFLNSVAASPKGVAA